MADDLRRFIADAKKLGFNPTGKNNAGHLQFVHSNGACYTTGSTPSDHNARKMALRDMEKISGQSLPRKRSGKYRFMPISEQPEVQLSPVDLDINALMMRAQSLRDQFGKLVMRAHPSDINTVRQLISDYEHIRQSLTDHDMVIDPIR